LKLSFEPEQDANRCIESKILAKEARLQELNAEIRRQEADLRSETGKDIDVLPFLVEVVATPLENRSGAPCFFLVKNAENTVLMQSRTTRLERLMWTGERFSVSEADELVFVDFYSSKSEKILLRLRRITLAYTELKKAANRGQELYEHAGFKFRLPQVTSEKELQRK
jgi:hypothetical protein